MPLFRIDPNQRAVQIRVQPFSTERALQRLIENNLETLLGVRFIATEFPTGNQHHGRIDTLGMDQDGTPVIIEYKKTSNENIITQGLFYLDWLVDHRGDFTLAAQNKLGNGVVINWQRPRLILIAEEFNKYDLYAVNRIGDNIELWTYRFYQEDLLYLERISAVPLTTREPVVLPAPQQDVSPPPEYTVDMHLQGKPQAIVDLFKALQKRIFSLSDEITERPLRRYITYKHGRNFAEVWIQQAALKIWLDIKPAELNDPLGLARDVSQIGHWGTGEVEVTLRSFEQLEAVMKLIEQAYRQTI